MYDKYAYVCLSEQILETTWMPSNRGMFAYRWFIHTMKWDAIMRSMLDQYVLIWKNAHEILSKNKKKYK